MESKEKLQKSLLLSMATNPKLIFTYQTNPYHVRHTMKSNPLFEIFLDKILSISIGRLSGWKIQCKWTEFFTSKNFPASKFCEINNFYNILTFILKLLPLLSQKHSTNIILIIISLNKNHSIGNRNGNFQKLITTNKISQSIMLNIS